MHLFQNGVLLALTLAPLNAATYDFVTFAGPGGANISPLAINNSGQIAGAFVDAAGVIHGFVRSANGQTITPIDGPGATATVAASIGNTGWVVGSFVTSGTAVGNVYELGSHGFRLSPDGSTLITIDVPGAASTVALGINSSGLAMGQYVDNNGVHAFLLAADGKTFTTFDAPGGVGETYASGMNDNGDVAGYIYGADDSRHGWVRTASGVFTTVSDPLASVTRALAINNAGQVAGIYEIYLGVGHAFVLSADRSTYTSIEPPGVSQSTPAGINSGGQVVEGFGSDSALYNGGAFPSVAVPGAVSSVATGINDSSQVTGSYTVPGTGGAAHTYGFLAAPMPQSNGPAIRTYYGVTGASGFGGQLATAPGSWIEIYGQNFAANTRPWQTSDFHGNLAPTTLDTTSVTIDGVPAYVSYISPVQVNALVPSSVSPGTATVTVTNGGLTSPPQNVTVNALQPQMLTDGSGLAAFFADGTYVAGCGGTPSRNAQPGDTVVLYGIGFGPVSPAIPAGEVVTQINSLQANFQALLSPLQLPIVYSGLAPGFTGLYQFNFVVPTPPQTGPSSNLLGFQLTWSVNGVGGASNCEMNIAQ